MCLSIPAKIIRLSGDTAIVSISGVEYEASVQLVDDVAIGDYVLLHAGFAIKKIMVEEAMETMQLLSELDQCYGEPEEGDEKKR